MVKQTRRRRATATTTTTATATSTTKKTSSSSTTTTPKVSKTITKQTRITKTMSATKNRTRASLNNVITPLRRSSRIRKAKNRASSYFDVVPVDVGATLVELALSSGRQSEALKTALSLPRDAVSQVIRTLREGRRGYFNTIGTKAYKQLNLLLRDVGTSVHTLSFDDKLVTKAYSKIVRTHCPNIQVLSVRWGCFFANWRVPAERSSSGIDAMLTAMTTGKKKLPELRFKVWDLGRAHMQTLSRHIKNVICVVLDWDFFGGVTKDNFEQLWIAAGKQNVAIKKIVLRPPKSCEDDLIHFQSISVHCPKVKVLIIDADDGERIVTNV